MNKLTLINHKEEAWLFVRLLKILSEEFEEITIKTKHLNDFPSGERFEVIIEPEGFSNMSFVYVEFEDCISRILDNYISRGIHSLHLRKDLFEK